MVEYVISGFICVRLVIYLFLLPSVLFDSKLVYMEEYRIIHERTVIAISFIISHESIKSKSKGYKLNEPGQIVVSTLITAIMAYSGGSNVYINTAYIIVALCFAALSPLAIGISLYAGIIVYLGYTYIELNSIIPGITNTGFTYILALVLLMRILTGYNGRVGVNIYKTDKLFLLYCFIYFTAQISISLITGVGLLLNMMLIWFLIRCARTDHRLIHVFIKALVFMLFSTYIYYFLWNEKFYMLNGRFGGARDPNNFAYLSNICIFFCLNDRIMSRRFRMIAILGLVIGILASLSMSGFATMSAVFLIHEVFGKKRRKALMALNLLLVVAIVLLFFNEQIFSWMISNNFMTGLTGRIQVIFRALERNDIAAATTNRSSLWEHYLAVFDRYSFDRKLFGDPVMIDQVMKNFYSSHNTFIDILCRNGMIGLIIFMMMILKSIRRNLRHRDFQKVAFTLVFLINLFFRSMGSFSMLFPLLI